MLTVLVFLIWAITLMGLRHSWRIHQADVYNQEAMVEAHAHDRRIWLRLQEEVFSHARVIYLPMRPRTVLPPDGPGAQVISFRVAQLRRKARTS